MRCTVSFTPKRLCRKSRITLLRSPSETSRIGITAAITTARLPVIHNRNGRRASCVALLLELALELRLGVESEYAIPAGVALIGDTRNRRTSGWTNGSFFIAPSLEGIHVSRKTNRVNPL